jgi:hypothetical protein
MTKFRACFCAAVALASVGCAADVDDASESTGSSSEALVGVDSYLYLRCNATGWGVDDATRLQPTSDPYLFQLEFDVTQAWMVSGGDQCVFTETPTMNGWGNWQKYYGRRGSATVQVPGGDLLTNGQNYFNVKYPALGHYRVTVNWRQGNFGIAAASTTRWPTNSVVPVLFVPTDWSVGSAEVQADAAGLRQAMPEIQQYYGTALASRLGGKTFRLNPLEVVQGRGPKESYGLVHNGRNIYEDGVEIVGNVEALVVDELHSRGYSTPPNQDESGYVTLIFVKGAGGWAGGREFGGADGGWAILGDWCIDSIDGTVPEGAYWWSGRRLQVGAAAHELGHTFGLPHPDAYGGDFGATIMGAWWDYPTVGFDEWGKNEIYANKLAWFQ